jgi:uncharacterized protein (TIGR02594 family)
MSLSLPIEVEGKEQTCGLIDQQWIIDRISVETWNNYRKIHYNIYKKRHQRMYDKSSWWGQLWYPELQTYSEFENGKFGTLLPTELDVDLSFKIFFHWELFWKVDLTSIDENDVLNRVRTAIVFLGICYPTSKIVWKRIRDVLSEISNYVQVFGLRLHPYLIAQKLVQDIDSIDENIKDHLNQCALYINDPNNTELIPLILEEDIPPWLDEAETLISPDTDEAPNTYVEHEITGQSTDAKGVLVVPIASVDLDDVQFATFTADRYQVQYSNDEIAEIEESNVAVPKADNWPNRRNTLTISGLTASQTDVTVSVTVEQEVDNPVIMGWANDLGIWYNYDSTAWCGLFTAHCMNTGAPNIPLPNSVLRARNWEGYGVAVNETNPPYGSVCVLWRGSRNSGQGHVFIVTGQNDDDIVGVGGNQSDSVTTGTFSRDRVVAIRIPNGYRGVPAPLVVSGALSENEQ